MPPKRAKTSKQEEKPSSNPFEEKKEPMKDNDISEMSEYERLRARNIERNNARLRSLGLLSAREEIDSNATAWRKIEVAAAPYKKRKKRDDTSTEPARKSLRLQGIRVPGEEKEDMLESKEERQERVQKQREEIVKECRETRLREAKAVADAGAEKAAKENPTATYEHCLMRVRTMTEKGLVNRVRVIERAAGKHCVVKMAIFKSCLQDEGMWELAQVAADALERLKGLQAPPE
mmetsp:Transcript_31971/g.46862  ORF Transcript_31971/g.46862 Transcript_31971/m.46862 type:complete len:234 (+) Transcript_31971:161-862(+)